MNDDNASHAGYAGCPCYDSNNNEITCACDMDTASCFESGMDYVCPDGTVQDNRNCGEVL